MGQISRVARCFYDRPWALLPEKLEAMEMIVAARLDNVEFSREEIVAAMGGSSRERPPYRTSGAVAIIPVFGVIEKRMSLFHEISGGVSTDKLKSDFTAALADPDVSAIVLDVDSPGGSVLGPYEVAQAIYAARGQKRIVAIANECMASAAYLIGAAADEVVTVESAIVGSIGTYMIHRDYSEQEQKWGLKTTIIRAGKYKASMERPLTEETQADLQDFVDGYYSQFVDRVMAYRKLTKDKALSVADGRCYLGTRAVEIGLADRVGTLDGIVRELNAGKRKPAQRGSANPGSGPGQHGGSAMADQDKEATGATGTLDPPAQGKPTEKAADNQLTAEQRNAIAAEERQRILDIKETAKALWHSDPTMAEKVADELAASGVDLEAAKAAMTTKLAAQRKPITPIDAGQSQVEKWSTLALQGLCLRFAGPGQEAAVLGNGKRPDNDQMRLRHMRMADVAREFLRLYGVDVGTMSDIDVAQMALSWEVAGLPRRPRRGVYGASDPGNFHTSGDFPNLLLDASNKTMLLAFDEAPTNWRRWVRQAEPVADFKNINRIRMSEGPDLELIPDGKSFPQGKMSDHREVYNVARYGKAFSVSPETIINDDMDAISRMNTLYGVASERTLNRTCVAVLTDNPTMADGTALFHANHSNVVAGGSGGVPSSTQMSKMKKLLRLAKGIDSKVLINLQLAWVMVPAEIEEAAETLLTSEANPDQSVNTGGEEDAARPARNSGTRNIWKNKFELIVEPLLDAKSTAKWYAGASHRQCDHVEVTFLRGRERPRLEEQYDFKTKGREMTVEWSWGVKAVEYRGICENAGA